MKNPTNFLRGLAMAALLVVSAPVLAEANSREKAGIISVSKQLANIDALVDRLSSVRDVADRKARIRNLRGSLSRLDKRSRTHSGSKARKNDEHIDYLQARLKQIEKRTIRRTTASSVSDSLQNIDTRIDGLKNIHDPVRKANQIDRLSVSLKKLKKVSKNHNGRRARLNNEYIDLLQHRLTRADRRLQAAKSRQRGQPQYGTQRPHTGTER